MRSREITAGTANSEEDIVANARDLFEMANLYPDTTGLPMTVWVSPRGSARHDVRVKVNTTHGNQMSIANTVTVGVRPVPHLIAGQLAPGDVQAAFAWIALNTDTLVAYWEGRIDTAQMIQALQPLPPRGHTGTPAAP